MPLSEALPAGAHCHRAPLLPPPSCPPVYSSSQHESQPRHTPACCLSSLGGELRYHILGPPEQRPALSRCPFNKRAHTPLTGFFQLHSVLFITTVFKVCPPPPTSLFNLQISDLILKCMQCRTVPKKSRCEKDVKFSSLSETDRCTKDPEVMVITEL